LAAIQDNMNEGNLNSVHGSIINVTFVERKNWPPILNPSPTILPMSSREISASGIQEGIIIGAVSASTIFLLAIAIFIFLNRKSYRKDFADDSTKASNYSRVFEINYVDRFGIRL